jgi:hypothetical protein
VFLFREPIVDFSLDEADPVIAHAYRLWELARPTLTTQMISAVVDSLQGPQTFEIDKLYAHVHLA